MASVTRPRPPQHQVVLPRSEDVDGDGEDAAASSSTCQTRCSTDPRTMTRGAPHLVPPSA